MSGVLVSDDDDARFVHRLYVAFAQGDRSLAEMFSPDATIRADPLLGAVREPYGDFLTFYGDLSAAHPELSARLREIRTIAPGRVIALGQIVLRGGADEIASLIAWGYFLHDGVVVRHIAELEPGACFREMGLPAEEWPSTSCFVGGEVLVEPREPADGA